jgi:carbon storage regulator
MLVLSRKINEKIRIGSDIIISVVAVSENQIKIGIEAPVSIKILRDELYENIKSQNKQAAEILKEVKPPAEFGQLKINKRESDD